MSVCGRGSVQHGDLRTICPNPLGRHSWCRLMLPAFKGSERTQLCLDGSAVDGQGGPGRDAGKTIDLPLGAVRLHG